MRTITVFAMCLFIAMLGCSPKSLSSRLDIYTLDFTPYQRDGFLITPEPYRGEYDCMGMIEVSYRPGITYEMKGGEGVHDPIRYQPHSGPTDLQWVVVKMHEEALKLGADGIMNFQLDYFDFHTSEGYVRGVSVSGWAIKRNEPI